MNRKLFFLFIFLFIISSCSFFSKKIENLTTSDSENSIANSTNDTKRNLRCAPKSNIQILLDDDSAMKFYTPLIPTVIENKSLSFIQKIMAVALIEMGRRPDVASPSSRFQYFLHYNHKDFYFDFYPRLSSNENRMSLIKGLDFLSRHFDKSKSLYKIAEFLDQTVPSNINVAPDFESFLKDHKNSIIPNETLSSHFLKGDEIITKHETFKRLNYKKIISLFYNAHLDNDSLYETPAVVLQTYNDKNIHPNIKCNFSSKTDDLNKQMAEKLDNYKSHYFGLSEDDNYFIAVTSSAKSPTMPNYKDFYLLKAVPSPRPIPYCQINNEEKIITLFSTKGKKPEQHIKHLISYDIESIKSYDELEDLLRFSRHLFLSNPDRILYESTRGRKSQLDFFLNMNFPIYHVDKLGDVMGAIELKNKIHINQSLIIDDRSAAKLWCKN